MPMRLLWAEDKIDTFVSVLPQKVFVERIGGDVVNVEVMVKAGYSPATYEPTPRQIAALAKAQLYIRIGVPFEKAWMPRIQGVNPKMIMLDAREGLTLRKMTDHHHGHDHDSDIHDAYKYKPAGNELDPHLWTDPKLVIKMAEQIRQQLIALQPDNKAVFTANHADFVAELTVLDEELQALFSESKGQKFMVFHPSWGYFAEAYGLEQIAIEADGKEPGARALTALIKQARLNGVKTIFVQPQFDKRAAKQVARAINGNVVAIDPLAADYFANMRKIAKVIVGIANE